MGAQPEKSPQECFVPLHADSLHEVAGPVGQISTMVDLFIRRQSQETRAEDRLVLNLIRTSCSHLVQLVNTLQEYTRVASSHGELHVSDGNALVARAISSLDSRIREAGAQVTHEDLPRVHCDPNQMIYAFTSLIDNAIKFRNEIRPEVQVAAMPAGGGWLFSVRDNGLGIEYRHRESVFHLFQRIHGERYAGSGAGLAITRCIVEQHGGRIWLESEPGHGSTFFFTLPVRQAGDHG